MRKTLLATILLLSGLMFAASVYAQNTGEKIQDFSAAITINPDSSLEVHETIQYDFGQNQKHGIYRDIPVSYKTSVGNTSIGLSGITVTDQNGTAYRFTTSRSGANEEIKIGDPNVLVSGAHTYVISYHVARAINYFKSYDELYWNVTGNGWQVPIAAASAQITLPQSVASTSLKTSCYEGALGSTESCSVAPANRVVLFVASRPLGPGEGLTAAVGFSKGVVKQPSPWQGFLQFILDNWVLGLPVLTLIGMTWLWWRKGRDPRGRGTIVPEYEAPDNLVPLEVSAILKEGQKDNKALSAEIIYLATQGYLKIERLHEKILFFNHTDYRFDKLKPSSGLSAADQRLIDALFKSGESVTLSDLKKHFYSDIPLIRNGANASVVSKGYFPANPAIIRTMYVSAGFFVMVAGFAIGLARTNPLMVASLAASGIVVAFFGMFMPRVSKQGAIMRERIKGLKLYLEIAEKNRIEFHNAPEKNPQLFEKLLPYAMVLGVEKQWAKQFEGIYMQPPSWYYDPQMGAFNAVLFTDSLHSFSASAAHTLASAPGGGSGSGGGGFSGGGFGGGGGGSW